MAKQIKSRDEAVRAIKAGVDKLADAVKVTMGPKGRYVALERKVGPPIITNDGVTIAREIELSDPFENMAAQLVKEIASKTNDVAGDGTTTATVLAQAIITEGVRNIAAGANAMHIKRGIDLAVTRVAAELGSMARQMQGTDEVEQIATISAGNKEIGKLIAEAVEKVGKDSVITVEESKSADTHLQVVKGMQFDRGYLSPYFSTDAEKMETVLEDAYVIVTDKKVDRLQEMLPFLENLLKPNNKPFLLIAESVEGDVLATLIVNKLNGRLRCCAVRAPSYREYQANILEDIAIITGGKVVSSNLGLTWEAVDASYIGTAKRVIVTKDATTIVGGNGSKEALEARITQLRGMETTPQTQERLAKLAGGVAVIKAGAATETEMQAKKYKIEDAINATLAGVDEGIVPGAGVALLRAAESLRSYTSMDPDEQTGIEIVRKALEQPARQIAENAGVEGSVVLAQIRGSANRNYGLNADTLEYGDLIQMGVIDPAKVVRSALQNAASIAGLLLTTEVLIADLPAK